MENITEHCTRSSSQNIKVRIKMELKVLCSFWPLSRTKEIASVGEEME